MSITFRQLEIFEKVSALGYVTHASRELLLTQSAVSMALSELERLAGAPLFERQGRRLYLNDRGRQILPDVREVLQKVRGIERFLNESVAEPSGVLKVGASTTIGNYLLPPLVGEFSRRYPRAKALLQVGNVEQVERGIERRDFDLGLVEGLAHPSSAVVIKPWRGDELAVVVGKGHEWAKQGQVSLEMLRDAGWVMREEGSGTREVFESAMAKVGTNFSISLELGHTEAIKKAVEAGLGVGCLSRIAVQRELDHGWLVEVATPLDLRRTLLLLFRPSEHQTTLLNAFVALLTERLE